MSINHKIGSTFELDCTLEFDGSAVDISGWDIRSEIRGSRNQLIDTPTVTITDAPNGKFTLVVADTDDWTPGEYETDIRYAFNGKEMYSETLTINVIRSITEEP